MKQSVSLITLGVADYARAKAFYEGLGWTATWEAEETAFFQANGVVLTLWSREKLAATTKDATDNTLPGRAVSWSSSTPSVATVSGSGLVTGLATGSTTVTATSEGQSGTSSITVSNVPVASVAVTPASAKE